MAGELLLNDFFVLLSGLLCLMGVLLLNGIVLFDYYDWWFDVGFKLEVKVDFDFM